MLVEDLMRMDVVSVSVTATVQQVAKTLLERRIGSVIVRSTERVPVGIVTTTDILEAGIERERPLADIPAAEYMSRPLLTIEADDSVRKAVNTMNDERIEQLVIVTEYDVAGVIAMTDILRAYEEIIQEAHDAEQPPSWW
ncbi:MAG: cyclic nucleotide-binding/CBS domain-containing protein [Halanaeroarchaeum sp.]